MFSCRLTEFSRNETLWDFPATEFPFAGFPLRGSPVLFLSPTDTFPFFFSVKIIFPPQQNAP